MARNNATAKQVAYDMESDDGEISHRRSGDEGRHVFNYEGSVHAHLLADGWEFRGFGSGWFAIKQE